MSVPVLEAIADAMMRFEGWYPTSRSNRNRNPGNLRSGTGMIGKDAGGYAIFASLLAGYSALLDDMWHKVTGRNEHGLNLDSTIMQMLEVYAPVEDGNNPRVYAGSVAKDVGLVFAAGVGPGTTFRQIYKFANQEPPGDGKPAA